MNMERLLLILSRPLAFVLDNTFDLVIGGKKRPKFLKPEDVLSEFAFFEKNFQKIKDEFLHVYNTQTLHGYEKFDPNQNYIANTVDTQKKWRVFVFNLMGALNQKNLDLCPTIKEGLAQIPGYFQAMFSVLEPGKSVPPHRGRYKGYLRYHLGVIIPPKNTPYILVGGEKYTWEEGKSVLIDDSWEHEVINNCDKYRVVFIIDIPRPLPINLAKLNHWMIHKLIKNTYAKKMKKNMEKIENEKNQILS